MYLEIWLVQYGYSLVMAVTEQSGIPENYHLRCTNGWNVYTSSSPDLKYGNIYLRGEGRRHNKRVTVWNADSAENALQAKMSVLEALSEMEAQLDISRSRVFNPNEACFTFGSKR